MDRVEFKKTSLVKEKYIFTSSENLLKDIKKYDYAILYKLDKVEVLKIDDVDNLDDLIELRAFNENGELHIVIDDDKVFGRTITECSGEEYEYVDETHLLWGEPKQVKDGYTLLSEDRGNCINVPFEVESGKRAFVVVRNYLSKSQFSFDDYRMVRFITREVVEYAKK